MLNGSQQDRQGKTTRSRPLLRRILPGLLILAGIAFVVYGAAFHLIPVLVKQDQRPAAPAPSLQLALPLAGLAVPVTPSPPQDEFKTISVSEPGLVKDVTVGGATRTASGQVKRTYTGKPLSLCPT